MVEEAGKAMVIVMNKWDLVDEDRRNQLDREIDRHLDQVEWAQRVNIAAKTGWHRDRLAPALRTALDSWERRVPTAQLNSFLGALIGVLAGYLGGRLDSFLMRLTDGVISLPLLPLLIVLAAIDPRKIGIPAEIAQSETFSLYRIVVIVALTGWTTVARLVRAETLSLKARDFTRAARALGARPGRIMFRHILPNAAGSLVVATTMSVGALILFESTLSFLGLGTQPPAASWGNMLTGAQELLQQAPMLALWPGLLIFLTVIAFNFVGDGLQDALDPRSERR